MRPLSLVAVVLALVLGAGAAVDAKKPIKPKAGGYTGKVTSGNGRGDLRLIVATFNTGGGGKPKKGVQLYRWIALLRCNDGSTLEAGPGVFAPLKGAKFSGKSRTSAQTVTLTGRFTTQTKLVGTARVVTTGASPHTQCDSGPVAFNAAHN